MRHDQPGAKRVTLSVLYSVVPQAWEMPQMTDTWHDSKLRGRQSERREMESLVHDIRANRGRVLVIRGEAGVSKSALLDFLAAKAAWWRLMRSTSVQSVKERPYAGLHQLCAPMLGRTHELPGRQRHALR